MNNDPNTTPPPPEKITYLHVATLDASKAHRRGLSGWMLRNMIAAPNPFARVVVAAMVGSLAVMIPLGIYVNVTDSAFRQDGTKVMVTVARADPPHEKSGIQDTTVRVAAGSAAGKTFQQYLDPKDYRNESNNWSYDVKEGDTYAAFLSQDGSKLRVDNSNQFQGGFFIYLCSAFIGIGLLAGIFVVWGIVRQRRVTDSSVNTTA